MIYALLALTVLVPAREVNAYRDELARVERASEPVSLEPLFSAAGEVKETLLPVIEDLSAEEFAEVERTLRGLVVNREEVLLAEPDAAFFFELARKHGRPADLAFFRVWRATFPGSVWPSYLEQQTDVSGCTRYGAGELVARYADWRAFQRRFPDAYRAAVRERLKDIEREITEGTCACGGKEETLAELRTFAERFGHLRADTSAMRYECAPH